MPNLSAEDLEAVARVNERPTHRIAGEAADNWRSEAAYRNSTLSCWNWALVGHVGGGVLVNGAAGDPDDVVYPNELYDYVARAQAENDLLVHGLATLLTGEPTGLERLETIRQDFQARRITKDVATQRVADLCARLNGLTLSDAPTRYELCMYYQRAEQNPSFEHWWLVVHDAVPDGALDEFDHSGSTIEHFTGLIDCTIYRGGQLGLHDDGGREWQDFRERYHVYRRFLDGLEQRQIDKIHNMIAYRDAHAENAQHPLQLDTRRIENWARDHWR